MKIRFCAALLLAALAIPILAGCAVAGQALDVAENAIAPRMEAAIPDASVPMAAAAPTAAPADPTPAATPAPTGNTASETLTREEAIAIALKHAGLEESQVRHLHAEKDYDHGKLEYEVDFHYDRWEYDYDIDAATGAILKWDKEIDD